MLFKDHTFGSLNQDPDGKFGIKLSILIHPDSNSCLSVPPVLFSSITVSIAHIKRKGGQLECEIMLFDLWFGFLIARGLEVVPIILILSEIQTVFFRFFKLFFLRNYGLSFFHRGLNWQFSLPMGILYVTIDSFWSLRRNCGCRELRKNCCHVWLFFPILESWLSITIDLTSCFKLSVCSFPFLVDYWVSKKNDFVPCLEVLISPRLPRSFHYWIISIFKLIFSQNLRLDSFHRSRNWLVPFSWRDLKKRTFPCLHWSLGSAKMTCFCYAVMDFRTRVSKTTDLISLSNVSL